MGWTGCALLVATALGATSCGVVGSDQGQDDRPDSAGSPGDAVEAGPFSPCSLIPDDKTDYLFRVLVPDDAQKTEPDLAVSETTALVYDTCRWEDTDEFGLPVSRVDVGVSVTPVSRDEYKELNAIARQEAGVIGPAADGSLFEATGGDNPYGFYTSRSEDGPYGEAMSELFVLHHDRVIIVSAMSRHAGGPSEPLLTRVAAEALRHLPEQVELSPPNVPDFCSRLDRTTVTEAMGTEVLATRGFASSAETIECAFGGSGRLVKVDLWNDDTGTLLDGLKRTKGARPVNNVGDDGVISASGVLTAMDGDRAVQVTVRPDRYAEKATAVARAALTADQ